MMSQVRRSRRLPAVAVYAPAMNSDGLATEASPLIGSLGSAFYFAPETLARGKELGLDGFRFYFLGRGGVLGDVEAPVVQSAFGYFHPDLVARMWNSARERCPLPPREVGRVYVEASREFGRRHFDRVEGLDRFCAGAEAVVERVDPAGLALYAGLAAEPLAEDLPGRAMPLLTVLREMRGSMHLLAVVAAGVSPRVAHYFRRPDDFAAFGYGEDDTPTLTEEDRRAMAAVDRHTDRLVQAAFGGLGASEAGELASGVRRMAAALKPSS